MARDNIRTEIGKSDGPELAAFDNSRGGWKSGIRITGVGPDYHRGFNDLIPSHGGNGQGKNVISVECIDIFDSDGGLRNDVSMTSLIALLD